MALPDPTTGTVRKLPRQARAKATVQAILEAAARILEKNGEGAVNTASVAHLAGCSIGTLYQYFSDRDDLLLALFDREQARIMRTTQELMAELGPGPAATRELVRVLVASFKARRGARRQFELVMAAAGKRATSSLITVFADAIVRRAGADLTDDDMRVVQARAFVLTRGVYGVLRSAALERNPIIDEPAFEDALCHLVAAFGPFANGRPEPENASASGARAAD